MTTPVAHQPRYAASDDDLGPAIWRAAGLDFLDHSRRPESLGRLGHYEILEELGRGAFGIVLRAFDESLHRVVAIKVLAPEVAASAEARTRFVREARAAAQIRHENVVQVHAIEESPVPYLVMEYVPGETLQRRMDAVGPLSPAETAWVGIQVARALAAAHDTGLVHRDVKPCNVLLEAGPERRVKLTDFGLARAAADARITQSGLVAGTPLYMAPEQARDDPLDGRADLFSLGSLLYAAVTGRPPFQAETPLGVLMQVCDGTPRPIPELVPDAPRWLCAAITTLHAKDRESRFTSATAVADALADGLADGDRVPAVGDSTTAVLPPPPAPRPPVDGRRKRMVLVSAAVAVAAAGVAVALWPRTTPAPAPGHTVAPAAATKPIPPPLPPFPPFPLPFPLPPPPVAVPDGGALLAGPWGEPESLGPGVNGRTRELSPALTADERTLLFVQNNRLRIARRAAAADLFGPAEPVLSPDADVKETVSITGDGRTLAFASHDRRVQVWTCERPAADGPFGKPRPLPDLPGIAGHQFSPVLSADGLTLLLTSPSAGTSGDYGVVALARPRRDEPFAGPLHTVLPACGTDPDEFVRPEWLSPDGRVLVTCRFFGTERKCRVHVRPTPLVPFGPAEPVTPLGATEVGRPWLSPDGQRMYFHSRTPPGGAGHFDLWVVRRVAP